MPHRCGFQKHTSSFPWLTLMRWLRCISVKDPVEPTPESKISQTRKNCFSWSFWGHTWKILDPSHCQDLISASLLSYHKQSSSQRTDRSHFGFWAVSTKIYLGRWESVAKGGRGSSEFRLLDMGWGIRSIFLATFRKGVAQWFDTAGWPAHVGWFLEVYGQYLHSPRGHVLHSSQGSCSPNFDQGGRRTYSVIVLLLVGWCCHSPAQRVWRWPAPARPGTWRSCCREDDWRAACRAWTASCAASGWFLQQTTSTIKSGKYQLNSMPCVHMIDSKGERRKEERSKEGKKERKK